MAEQLSVDVIMPVLNEAREIGTALARLDGCGFSRTIIVDGGSRDGTLEQVETWVSEGANRTALSNLSGRAAQMNRGARESCADVLLFLHCDCTLPVNALELIRAELQPESSTAGAFVIRTLREGHPRRTQQWMWLADLRSRYTRHPYGDQAVFVLREVFEDIGGFPDAPILEDLFLSRALARRGTIARIDRPVIVSSRRFGQSPFRTGALMRLIPLLARLGFPLRFLSALYPPAR